MEKTIECIDISASKNNFQVLKDFNIKIEIGKIYGIVGQNGSGKTTFAELLSGVITPDSGKILIDGKEVKLKNTGIANSHGIYMISQSSIIPKELTVYKNLAISFYRKNHKFIINKKEIIKKAEEIFKWIGIDIDVNKKTEDLLYHERQLVEFAKAIICEPKVLILDEPTYALMDINKEIYIDAIKRLNQMGTTIILISHRIKIIDRLCEKVFIFKDKNIEEYSKNEITEKSFFEYMTGNSKYNKFPKLNLVKDEVLFEIRNLSGAARTVTNVNLTIRKGEIVGITGLYGSGQTSIANILFGFEKYKSGEVYVEGEKIKVGSAKSCIEHGIGYIHKNIKESLLQNQTVEENIILGNFEKLDKHLIMGKEINKRTKRYIEQLNLKKTGNKSEVQNYSIGSQQKIIFAKWLFAESKILILDEPTKNVDIVSKVELYNLMTSMLRKDKGILLLTSDLDELIGMCDRIYIMYEGSVVKKMKAKNITKDQIISYAMGNN